jgi:hypothetical protein
VQNVTGRHYVALTSNRNKEESVVSIKRYAAAVLAALTLFAAACSGGPSLTAREKGALAGAGAGTATGAILGGAAGHPGAGAAIGGLGGAAGGYIFGDRVFEDDPSSRVDRR